MSQYYKEQMRLLREESVVFAQEHPALAPLLLGQGQDPDVERILEGTAFLCGKISEQLDRGFPELVQSLMRVAFPQALLPVPSMTLIQFTPVTGLDEPLFIPAGAQVASGTIDGTRCVYSTTVPLTALPLTLEAAPEPTTADEWQQVSLSVRGTALQASLAHGLTLHLTGNYDQAVERFQTLLRRLDHLEVRTGTAVRRFPASSVRAAFFPLEDNRLPALARRNHSYMEALRYFVLPQQLLFIRIEGLETLPLRETDTQITLGFCLNRPFETLPSFSGDWAALNVVPASNVFRVSAEPFVVTHTQEEYPIRPRDAQGEHFEILSLEKVTLLSQSGDVETCLPYERQSLSAENRSYALHCRATGTEGETAHLLTFLHKPGENPDSLIKQTASIDLTCCHLSLPGRLRVGDLTCKTDHSPAQTAFTNIAAPTPTLPRTLNESLLWRFLSHINTNILSSGSAESLRSMLELYIPDSTQAPELSAANRRRCEGIVHFRGEMEDMLFHGRPLRGQNLNLTLDPTAFSSRGDMLLFAGMLDRFLAGYAVINCYFRLTLTIAGTGETYSWPPRLGEKQLL